MLSKEGRERSEMRSVGRSHHIQESLQQVGQMKRTHGLRLLHLPIFCLIRSDGTGTRIPLHRFTTDLVDQGKLTPKRLRSLMTNSVVSLSVVVLHTRYRGRQKTSFLDLEFRFGHFS